ncbi:Protein CBG09973 [Caenorhabditis briggsae]|uniref:Protein CBG09973 n=1 Tax=Caenorhabditis briggsae TaxID=6238 RepID=A8XA26_CAEBR|nr:Protein CBG09973 [Caenorhabditis briggsae]CAP29493.2 Protein CBG09973 [Caenorhabditis briggsae]
MSECKYQDGSCPIKKNEIMIWDVNTSQNCQYISIRKLDGIMNNGLWINSENQIALSLNKNNIVRDCNLDLLISDEGFAVRQLQNEIPRIPTESKFPRSIGLTQQALPSTPSLQEMSSTSEISRSEGLSNPQKYAESSTPRSEGLYQKEREEYYKRQREIQKDRELREQQIQMDRNRIQKEKDKEVRDKYEADRKEFEKRREEKMKQYLEFEKRKKEKMERQGLLNTTTTTSVNSNKIKDSEIQRIETTNRIKRSIEANQSLEDTSRPFPLPTYEEYSKIKNDCSLLPSYADYLRSKDKEIKDFIRSKDACDTFPSYDEYRMSNSLWG